MAKSSEIAHSASPWQALAKLLFDHYRPELHYMRGPGPKWHEKHDGPRLTARVRPELKLEDRPSAVSH
jgi:hypothetical protein